MVKFNFGTALFLCFFLTACGGGSDTPVDEMTSENTNSGGTDSEDTGSEETGSEETGSGDTGSGDTGSGGTSTKGLYSPYAGGTGKGSVRLKTMTDSYGYVNTYYYHDDPIRSGLLSHTIETDGYDIETYTFEYLLGNLSKVTVVEEESSSGFVENYTMDVEIGSMSYEPIQGPVVASGEVRGSLGSYSKSYTYDVNDAGNAYRISKVEMNNPDGSLLNMQTSEYDSEGRLERVSMKGNLGSMSLVAKYEYDSANNLTRYYQGFIDTTSSVSENDQFIERYDFTYTSGLGGVQLVSTVEEFERDDSSSPWESWNIETYQYESGDCNYRYLQVFPVWDFINSPFIKTQCPH